MKNLSRRQIRYLCFRLQTEATGGPAAEGEHLEEVRAHMEAQEDFGGWVNFAKTWDVDVKAPLVAVLRTESIATEWRKVVEAEAKDLPFVTEAKKSPKG